MGICNEGLEEELKAIGNPMQRVLARTVTGDSLFDVNISKILPDSLKYNGSPVAYTVMRSDLQAVLESKLPAGNASSPAAFHTNLAAPKPLNPNTPHPPDLPFRQSSRA